MEKINGSILPKKEWINPLISILLGLALAFSLLPKSHEKAKFDISEILTVVWFVYGVWYKDYPVVIICVIILLFSLNQTPSEQVMSWP
ncbi:hypothetical protein IIV30_112L [Invertebrate iridescent virus 30]|uniref:Uncharacterized protein n=1 Tax=Invertebrate iridescent virus 30 TaxID=345585 RepID=W8W1S7_9VIRU|nr:hypothetical protein IIV30_112L [Invertebrate iridescent virus 30]CCV02307.1 hypothetical protein IIV30_112L [Invertebrate iridescent virus 30]